MGAVHFSSLDTEVMIKTGVLTGWGQSRQCVFVGLCHRGRGSVQSPILWWNCECTVCARKHFLSKLHADTHSHSADELFSEGLLLQQRWHKPFSSYLWPSTPYNTHSHTGSATNPLPPSLFKAWFLFIKSVSSLFLISTFLCWMLFYVKSNPSFPHSLYLAPSLCSSSHLCPLSIMLSPPHLLSPPLVLSLSLLSFAPPFICLPFSISTVFLSLPLALLSLCLPFSVLFTALLSACSPLLFSSVTSHPLFSLCRSLFPFLFSQPFSPSLLVSALCGSSAPSGTSSGRKGWKTNCGAEKGGWGKVAKDWKGGKERKKRGCKGRCKGDQISMHAAGCFSEINIFFFFKNTWFWLTSGPD